uniref:DNA POLYMERASE n=1 Tax=Podoviridae sp. ctIKM86 TaxID=2827729 RepID=A0A8S5SME8_9CAUD|nr:MAG TPA: DNA POLYMERASE [Podoviridae sp. ctIKM86]
MKILLIVNPKVTSTEINNYYSFPTFELFKLNTLALNGKKKLATTDIKNHFNTVILPYIESKNIDYLGICDADYFKVLHKVTKPDTCIGYVFNNISYKYAYIPNCKAIFYHPEETKDKINRAREAIINDSLGSYKSPGSNIIHFECYPKTEYEINKELTKLLHYPALTCDIETYSLHHVDAGLGSICFCWDEHNGIAFKIDKDSFTKNTPVRKLLRAFFIFYKGTLIFHNIAFDVTVLIYQLFMKDILDTKGLLYGLDIMLKNWEDTKLITYLCTNSCSGNNLGLKYQAQEFAGNWAEDEIGDITKIPQEELLRYNLIDGLSTWFVYNKYKDKLIQDKQDKLYNTIFKGTTKDIIQMQLTGIPLNMDKVKEAEVKLNQDKDNAVNILTNNKHIKDFTLVLKQSWVDTYNATHTKKQVTIQDSPIEFNPNSGKQIKELLYDNLHLPVINLTESKQPATDGDTLKALMNHVQSQDIKDILQALIDYSAAEKILTAFIPAFKKAVPACDGRSYLYGSFNLGGTVSGRLSSSKPNLQNLPATGSKYAKLIKACFQAPKGWLWVGLDYSSLEDHISALVTKDPNKLKVYTDEYDGHCLRAYSYWTSLMPDITAKLDEIHKEGKVYKVTYDDGSIEYLNENNPKLIKLRGNSNESNSSN